MCGLWQVGRKLNTEVVVVAASLVKIVEITGVGVPSSGKKVRENLRERSVFPIADSKEAQTGRGRNNNKPIDRWALRVTQPEAWRPSIPQ